MKYLYCLQLEPFLNCSRLYRLSQCRLVTWFAHLFVSVITFFNLWSSSSECDSVHVPHSQYHSNSKRSGGGVIEGAQHNSAWMQNEPSSFVTLFPPIGLRYNYHQSTIRIRDLQLTSSRGQSWDRAIDSSQRLRTSQIDCVGGTHSVHPNVAYKETEKRKSILFVPLR